MSELIHSRRRNSWIHSLRRNLWYCSDSEAVQNARKVHNCTDASQLFVDLLICWSLCRRLRILQDVRQSGYWSISAEITCSTLRRIPSVSQKQQKPPQRKPGFTSNSSQPDPKQEILMAKAQRKAQTNKQRNKTIKKQRNKQKRFPGKQIYLKISSNMRYLQPIAWHELSFTRPLYSRSLRWE